MSGNRASSQNSNNRNQPRRNNKRQRRRQRRSQVTAGTIRRRTRIRNTPAARGYSTTANAIIQFNNGRTTLRGKEIFNISVSSSSIFDFALPFVPTKWTGTRSAALTSTYNSFRPLFCHIQFQPAVPTSQGGTITFGTYFNGTTCSTATRDNSMSTLPTTNGGFLTTIYTPSGRSVALRTSLSTNLYPTTDVDPDDVPFWIVCTCSAPNVNDGSVIGQVIVTYTIALHNPTNQALPSTGSRDISFNLVEINNNKYLQCLKTSVLNPLSQGRDYFMYFPRFLYNTTSEILLRPLQFLQCTLDSTTTTSTLYSFLIDNAYATLNGFIGNIMGSPSQNFQ